MAHELVELVAEALPHETKKGNTYRVAVPRDWITVKAQSEEEAIEKANANFKKKAGANGDVVINPDNLKQTVKGKVN